MRVLCRSGKLRGVYSIYTIVIHQLFTVICGLCVYLDNMPPASRSKVTDARYYPTE